jgi:hypothetical protein
MIQTFHAAMEVLVYWAEKITILEKGHSQGCLNRNQQAATKWSEATRERSFDWLEHYTFLIAAIKCKLLTADTHVDYQIPLSDAENTANTLPITDTDRHVSQFVIQIDSITSNQQVHFMQVMSNRVIPFKFY